MRRPIRAVRGQAGFALLELAIAAALASLIAVWTASLVFERIDDARSEATGRWLLGLRSALEQMLVREYDALSGVEPHSGRYADPMAPTMAELKAAGHLAQGYPERSPLGLGASLQLLRSGTCPGAACRLEALAATPTVLPGDPGLDPTRVGQVLLSTSGYGGSVAPPHPNRVRGALFDLPNPLVPGAPALPAGAVAVYASLDLTQFDRFVRMRDIRDPALRGDFSVDGQVHARAAIRAEGDIASEAGISAQGRVAAGEFLHLRSAALEGTACEAPGLVSRDAAGALLACSDGVWRKPGGNAWLSPAYSVSAGTQPVTRTFGLVAGARFCALAHHFFTVNSLIHDGYNFAHACSVQRSAAGQWELAVRADTGTTACQAVCLR